MRILVIKLKLVCDNKIIYVKRECPFKVSSENAKNNFFYVKKKKP